jgi:hypothetical protein
MPIYSYWCKHCGLVVEQVVSYADRDKPRQHDGPNYVGADDYLAESDRKEVCGGSLERREGLELPTIGKEGFQTKAIYDSGHHVNGHFGKMAASRRKS